MSKYNKVIFICRSNTSRSPMAEAIFNSMEDSSDIKVMSRGSVVLFSEPINPKAEVVLNNHNLSVKEHTARQLEKEDIDDSTLVLTMSEALKIEVIQEYSDIKNLYTLPEFVGENGDVVDPYGGTLAEYEACFTELVRLVNKTVYKINEK